MWTTWFVVTACATLSIMQGAYSNAGLTSTSFSNELRTGFSRLFQNGIEQPLQQSPFVLLNPTEFQSGTGQLVQRPAPFSPLAATGYQLPRPRYPLPRGGKRPNDVLVVVVKTRSNCTAPAANGTAPADGNDDDDEDDSNDNDGLNPDDDIEEVTIVAGGAEKGKEPSRCVWAILSCCAPANTPIRYTCFDVLGCSAAFWDTNPCVPAILKTALDQATQFYGTATNRTTTPAPTPPAVPAAAATDNVASLTVGTSAGTAATGTPVDLTTPAAATA